MSPEILSTFNIDFSFILNINGDISYIILSVLKQFLLPLFLNKYSFFFLTLSYLLSFPLIYVLNVFYTQTHTQQIPDIFASRKEGKEFYPGHTLTRQFSHFEMQI